MKTTKRSAGCAPEARTGRTLSWLFPLALMAMLFALPQSAGAGERPLKEYALLYGTVWSAGNRPARGVTVNIQREGDKKAKWERISDSRGEFAVRVPVGTADYIIFAEVKTAHGKKRFETKAHVEQDERVDFTLHLGE